MVTEKIILNAPERFQGKYSISSEKLTRAVEAATDKLEMLGRRHGCDFPSTWPVDFSYDYGENRNWVSGMYAGCYWLGYQLSGNKFLRDMAEKLTLTFRPRFDKKIAMSDHDVGFGFSPSCIAAYNVTGDEESRALALEAAEYFHEHSYSKEGKFIIRSFKKWDDGSGCRTMMDSLMNAPLLYWAAKETGRDEYYTAACDHARTIERLLVRADGSTYHHYQFDPKTAAPVRGLTCQGRSDESCWSRGQSWGIYGFPIAYRYSGEDYLRKVTKDITYFMLNHLSDDLIPCWDYDFVSDKAIKDSSAGVIAVCGMHEMASLLPDSAEEKAIYEVAAAKMLEAAIDKCTGELGIDYDALLFHVTAALPQGAGIDRIAVYGDYFYLEALAKFTLPNFKTCW